MKGIFRKLSEFDEDEDDAKRDFIVGLVSDILKIVILSVIVILGTIYFTSNPIKYPSRQEPVVETMVVKDLYKSDGTYYISVLNKDNNAVYNIEVDKSNFIKYKINDEIKVYIVNNKARLYE